jgi:FkbM family methyltransferase
MKRTTIRRINKWLRPRGLRLLRTDGLLPDDQFRMAGALNRVASRGTCVKTVFDVGASNGCWSERTRRVFPDAKYIAVEALEEWREPLQRLSESWSGFDYVIGAAGASADDIVQLDVSPDLVGSTVGGSGGQSRAVPAITLDQLAETKSAEGPYLLKFDTHGYELPILEGAKNVLNETEIVIMEVYNYEIQNGVLRFHEMVAVMEEKGFFCVDIADPMLRPYDQTFWQMDLFFQRRAPESPIYSQYA